MNSIIVKLEKRFSPEFSRLLAKRVMNTPIGFGERCPLFDNDTHPLNHDSTYNFTLVNSGEHLRQAFLELTETKTKG